MRDWQTANRALSAPGQRKRMSWTLRSGRAKLLSGHEECSGRPAGERRRSWLHPAALRG